MARIPRLFIAEIPYVVQRGNNKSPILFSDNDCLFFLKVHQKEKIKYPFKAGIVNSPELYRIVLGPLAKKLSSGFRFVVQ